MQLEQELQQARQQVRGASIFSCEKFIHSFLAWEVQELFFLSFFFFFFSGFFSMQAMFVPSGIPGDLSHNMAATGNGEDEKQSFESSLFEFLSQGLSCCGTSI